MQNFAPGGFSVPQLAQVPAAIALRIRAEALGDRDVLDAGGALRLPVEAVYVAVEEGAHRHQRVALDALELVSQLGRNGGLDDVGGAADRAPLEAFAPAVGVSAGLSLPGGSALAGGTALAGARARTPGPVGAERIPESDPLDSSLRRPVARSLSRRPGRCRPLPVALAPPAPDRVLGIGWLVHR